MKLLFDQNLSPRLPRVLEDIFPESVDVRAIWLTGFDLECLATLYIDKPMRAHNLIQVIARSNRVFPDKDCDLIIDYNGMLKSLREALAQYALGDEDEGGGALVACTESIFQRQLLRR